VILGKGPTWDQCKFDCEVWGINDCYLHSPTPIRIDLVQQIKDISHVPEYGDVEELRKAKELLGFELVTATPIDYKDLHEDRLYPIREIVDHFQSKFFSNSFTWLMALAIYEKFDKADNDKLEQIELYGCDLRGDHEYLRELASMDFWCGVAMGRGIRIKVPQLSAVLKYPNGVIYGSWGNLQDEIEAREFHG